MEKSVPQQLQEAIGGSFPKTVLLQKRVRELVHGAKPLVDTLEKNPIRIALLELEEGLVDLEVRSGDEPAPAVEEA